MVFLNSKMYLNYLYYCNKVIQFSCNHIIVKIACLIFEYNWKYYIILFL